MLKFLSGLSAGTALTLLGLWLAFDFSTIKFNTCYLTESGQRVAWAGAVFVNEDWVKFGTTETYDFIILGDLTPCPVGGDSA